LIEILFFINMVVITIMVAKLLFGIREHTQTMLMFKLELRIIMECGKLFSVIAINVLMFMVVDLLTELKLHNGTLLIKQISCGFLNLNSILTCSLVLELDLVFKAVLEINGYMFMEVKLIMMLILLLGSGLTKII